MTDGGIVTSQPQDMVDVFRLNPKRVFTISDFVDMTGKSNEAVRQELSRFASNGDGAGPVKRVDHGLYQYDETREDPNILALLRNGYWRVENLRFIKKGVQGGSEIPNPPLSDAPLIDSANNPQPRHGFPLIMITGQKITWVEYTNGTQEIRLSANKKAPFSPDNILTHLNGFEKLGFKPEEWTCISIELNIEGRYWRVDASLSVKLIEGLLLKVYQHGRSTRIELADRRAWTVPEVISWLNAFANGFDGAEALTKVKSIEERVIRTERLAKLAYNVASKVRDGSEVKKKQDLVPSFKRASELVESLKKLPP